MNIKDILDDISKLSSINGVNLEIIGYSMLGKPIYALHIGQYDGPQMIMEGGTHAREYISTLFLIEETKYLSSFDIRNGGIYIVPCVNPDGVDLVLSGVKNIPCKVLADYLLMINGSRDFGLWKANANTVDINVNYDALFGSGNQNVFCPAPGNFVGYYPNSERETRVMIDFTAKVVPSITLSWHTKGEVIYYGFETLDNESLTRDYNIGAKLSESNGYPLVRTTGSVGGYSDYVSAYYNVPAYTIEVGSSTIPHPIGREYLMEIFEINKNVPIIALESVGGIIVDIESQIRNLFDCEK